jgi:hypothetical protein
MTAHDGATDFYSVVGEMDSSTGQQQLQWAERGYQSYPQALLA